MKNKFFILSLLVLAYGAILGHEVFLGHHLSHNANYNHHSCGSDSHKGSNLPCLLDLNPHFIPATPDLLTDYSEQIAINHDYLLNAEPVDFEPFSVQAPLLFLRLVFELPASPITRGFSLRGPPAA